jgi:predicted cupin superfamily sugar epimerase
MSRPRKYRKVCHYPTTLSFRPENPTGDPVELTELLPDGTFRRTVLGQDLGAGQEVQHMVEPGTWQGSRLAPGGRFALMGTTMCPGFTPDCYEQGDRETLLAAYPGAAEEIMQLTKERRP